MSIESVAERRSIRVRYAGPTEGYGHGPALKIQAEGPELNREYGLSEWFSIEAESALATWLEANCGQTLRLGMIPSLASEKSYANAEAWVEADGTVKLHIPGPAHNRPDGALLVFSNAKHLKEFLIMCKHASTHGTDLNDDEHASHSEIGEIIGDDEEEG